jgi:hypothetical protein
MLSRRRWALTAAAQLDHWVESELRLVRQRSLDQRSRLVDIVAVVARLADDHRSHTRGLISRREHTGPLPGIT